MQPMTFEEFQSAQLEKITPQSTIEVGDILTNSMWSNQGYVISHISDMGFFVNQRIDNLERDWNESRRDQYWASTRKFFDSGNFYKVIRGKDYDPKQQPYEDTDI